MAVLQEVRRAVPPGQKLSRINLSFSTQANSSSAESIAGAAARLLGFDLQGDENIPANQKGVIVPGRSPLRGEASVSNVYLKRSNGQGLYDQPSIVASYAGTGLVEVSIDAFWGDRHAFKRKLREVVINGE